MYVKYMSCSPSLLYSIDRLIDPKRQTKTAGNDDVSVIA